MAADYVLFAGMTALFLALIWVPALLAYGLARLSSLPRRFAFAFVSTLLVYGLGAFSALLLYPIELAETELVPQLSFNGHTFAVRLITKASSILMMVPLPLTAAAAVVVPILLRRHWSSVVASWGANNSFKPKPLRGSA